MGQGEQLDIYDLLQIGENKVGKLGQENHITSTCVSTRIVPCLFPPSQFLCLGMIKLPVLI